MTRFAFTLIFLLSVIALDAQETHGFALRRRMEPSEEDPNLDAPVRIYIIMLLYSSIEVYWQFFGSPSFYTLYYQALGEVKPRPPKAFFLSPTMTLSNWTKMRRRT
jgi:hypothetical protein